MNNIDPSRIKWIKKVNPYEGQSWAYFEDYTNSNQQFALHWTEKKKDSANRPIKGDILIVFQNYKMNGIRLTHLVEVIDECSFIDSFGETARMVKILHRTKNIINGHQFKYVFRPFTNEETHYVHSLDPSATTIEIQNKIYDLFKNDKDKYFYIENLDSKFELNFPPNKLYDLNQRLVTNSKILTLIGENGCGKSAILESIFSSFENTNNLRCICFSSGQNELFSKIFSRIQNTNKHYILKTQNDINPEYEDEVFDIPIKAFYFDKSWARLLIFFASTLFVNGRVSNFLKHHRVGRLQDNLDIKLKIAYRVDWNYVTRVKNERVTEAKGYSSDFLNCKFHRKLSWFLDNVIINKSYDYELPIKKSTVILDETLSLRVFQEKSSDLIFNFFWYASRGIHSIFDIGGSELFINGIELDDFSDGEYQLLSIYALIDHFDHENAIFLFDEIDSHLYYKNIKNLWSILDQVTGKVITTTHISNSIRQNEFNSLKLIQDGKIEENLTLKELASRISDFVGEKQYEYELAKQAENIVLIDDEVDFTIFKKLVQKKIGIESTKFLEHIIPFKRESNCDNPNIHLGKSKLIFAQEFSKRFNSAEIKTKNLFLICDKDKFSADFISDRLSVNIGDEYREVKENRKFKTHLLCWKRNEIENYLLSYTMLEHFGKLDEFMIGLNGITLNRDSNFDNITEIAKYEAKDLLHPLYKPNGIGFDETLLDNLIQHIPANEISDDIVTMYNVLKENIG